MLVAPPVPLSEQAPILSIVKMVMSVAGLIVFCLGAILYLCVLVRERTGAAAQSRRAPMVQGADDGAWKN